MLRPANAQRAFYPTARYAMPKLWGVDMNAYAVNVYEPGAFEGWYATVTATDGIRGVGYGPSERQAISNAWREYWRKAAA